MKNHFINFTITTAFLLSMPASAQMMGMMQGGGMMQMSTVRHQFVSKDGVDPKYASKSNPLKATSKNIAVGKSLYGQNCAICHGSSGLGDGAAGKNLNPPPTNIEAFSKMPMATDGYLYWTIAEGGAPVGSAMPSFKGNLKTDEIWKIILYLRNF